MHSVSGSLDQIHGTQLKLGYTCAQTGSLAQATEALGLYHVLPELLTGPPQSSLSSILS